MVTREQADTLECLLDLPPTYRITVLAMMGEPDAMQYEASRLDAYTRFATRVAAEGRSTELLRNIEAVQAIRRECRQYDL